MAKTEAKGEGKKGKKKKEEIVEAKVEEEKTETSEVESQPAVTEETEKSKEISETVKEEAEGKEEKTETAAMAESQPAVTEEAEKGKEKVEVEKEKPEGKETVLEKEKESKKAGVSASRSPQIDKIISTVEKMTILELSDLIKALEEKFGVMAAAPVAAMPTAAPAAGEEKEKTEWNVHLTAVGEKKIQVIKEVRAVTSLGLKEAKTLVEEAPKSVKEGLSKKEAEEIKSKLEAAGATVELK